jgi:outer membrane receptor protein involved in Fe transport
MAKRILVFAVGVSLLAALPLFGQTFRGSIIGTVTDPSGAVVVGAKVTVRNVDTGLERTTETDDTGFFTVTELPVGNYSVTVEMSGFQTALASGFRVEVAAARRVDVALVPGAVGETVEVTATIPLVETTSNVLGGAFESRQVEDLPINGRDYTKLLIMVPGAAGEPNAGGDSPGSFGLFSVNGNRGRSNNFLIDGTDMNDGYRNLPAINQGGVFGTPGTVLPVESIAELRVLSNFEPEYGRNAGSVVNIVTKSGTNDFHGSLFEFFRHDSLNARNFFDAEKGKFNNNQFGASVGGPLAKNRTFFYVTYEAQREKVGIASVNAVPTMDDFEDAVLALDPGGPGCAGTSRPVDCLNNQAAGVVNDVPLRLFNFCNDNGGCSGGPDVWPLANIPGAGGGGALNSFASAQAFNDADSFIVKIDHSFNDANHISGRYFFGQSDQSFPLGLVGGSNLPGTNTFSPIRAQFVSISDVHVFSGGARVNEARFGWNYYQQDFLADDRDVFGNPNTSIGLNNGASDPRDFGLPEFIVGDFAQLGSGGYANPRGRDDTNWHFIDNVAWKAGRHDLKFGYEFRRTTVDSFYDALFRGRLGFDTLADFLDGVPSSGRLATGVSDRNTHQNSHALYVQDAFRWRPNFTLNLGLRWEYYGVLGESRNRFSNYDPAVGLFHPAQLYPKDWNNFGPRVSFAWDVGSKGKTVLRGGFGVFNDIFSQDFFTGQIPWNCFLCTGVAYNAIEPDPIFLSLTPVAQLSDGDFAWDPATTGPGTLDTFEVFNVDAIRTPYVFNFNLNLQQQLGKDTVVQIGYVGSAGRKLYRIRDINQPDQAAIDAFDPVNGCCVPRPFDTEAGLSAVAPSVPFYVNQVETAANSSYNGLQVSFRQVNWRGFTQQVTWTWSHSIDTASDGQEFVPNAAQPQDSTNARGNRANSNFDVRHRFVWSLTYDFPKWEAAGRFGEGWQVSGILTLMSGHPFNLNYFFDDDYDGSGSFYGRPDIIGTPRYNQGDPLNFLDLSVFRVPCTLQDRDVDGDTVVDTSDGTAVFCAPGSRHFGSLGRNGLLGPDFRQLDISIVKSTRITERYSIQFRADFFNVVNHPNFANPYLPIFFAPAAPNGIDPATGISLGSYPIVATSDVGLGNPILAGGGPRSIQFALKFIF